ncbi:septum site-determining protein MinC [Sansalvadorimonas verongulae]|uniref:septum site-determining protein MinC n=1 Tax=Sansalvadorimonas verongulae TaxID=2172824 RepID=UPI0012BC6039|nr:septum site-determining protein MinC [Sansalvadorimonas verongulae]MTI12220.1 septum site-determining protein MinC [Sansalvadorimonas verongulae]
MTSIITPHTASPCFQLKGSMVTMMTLELYRFNEMDLHQQLQALVVKAPRFFENTPVIVSLEHFQNPTVPIDMLQLMTLCSDFGINLIAVRGGSAHHRAQAAEIGLACLPAQPMANIRKPAVPDSAKPVAAVSPLHKPSTQSQVSDGKVDDNVTPLHTPKTEAPRIIKAPIRSGQQVFHDGDLILTGPVSPGAEVLATGNLHAYGAFRGRALVGVKGNAQARIFCTRFEAELVSINGHYKMSATMNKSLTGQIVQAYLQDEALVIEQIP